MGYLNHGCPHCGAQPAAFAIVAAHGLRGSDTRAAAFLRCLGCDHPAAALLAVTGNPGALPVTWFTQDHKNPVDQGWTIVRFFPPLEQPQAPEHVPEAVGRIFREAERCRHLELCDAAALAYGKTLDAAFQLFPGVKGQTLAARIERLAQEGQLVPSLAQLAGGLRGIRNEATHDLDPFSKDDTERLGEATKLILAYLFTLPGRIAALKTRRDEHD